ncbi:2927_t:CDS:2, partial [Gigaspora rosea]
MLPETNTNDNVEDLIYDDTNEKIHEEEKNSEKKIHDEENNLEKKIHDEENNLEKKIQDEESNSEKKIQDEENNLDKKVDDEESNLDKKVDDEESNLEKMMSEDKSEIELISAAVSTTDDPNLPCLTFRFWVLSTEHVCISAAANAGGVSAYAEIIAIQELFYGTKVNFLIGFLLLISTQMIGFGLAGFIRKTLVRPINMIWPKSLVFAAMFNTLHGNISETNDKIRFFYTAFISMFVWQFVPEYMFPWLA